MDARKTLTLVADWLSWQDDALSLGLKTAHDALRLYEYGQCHEDLPEMADAWTGQHRIQALGYDPITNGKEVIRAQAEKRERAVEQEQSGFLRDADAPPRPLLGKVPSLSLVK